MDDSNSLGSLGSMFGSQPTERTSMAGSLRLFDEENTVCSQRYHYFKREAMKSFNTPPRSNKPIVMVYEPQPRRTTYRWGSKFAHYDRQGVQVPNRLIRKVQLLKELKQHFRSIKPHQANHHEKVNKKPIVKLLTRAQKLCVYEWISDIVYTMGYSRSTYHKTVNLFEKLNGLNRMNCQLYVVTCLMLAAKLQEHSVHVSSFVEMCKGLHTQEELLNCEMEVLTNARVVFQINSEVILDQAEELMRKWDDYLKEGKLIVPNNQLLFNNSTESGQPQKNQLQMALIMDRLLVLGKLNNQAHNYHLAAAAALFVIIGLEVGEVMFDRPARHIDPRKYYTASCKIIQEFVTAKLPEYSLSDLFEVLPDVLKVSAVLQHLPGFIRNIKDKHIPAGQHTQHLHLHFKELFEQPKLLSW